MRALVPAAVLLFIGLSAALPFRRPPASMLRQVPSSLPADQLLDATAANGQTIAVDHLPVMALRSLEEITAVPVETGPVPPPVQNYSEVLVPLQPSAAPRHSPTVALTPRGVWQPGFAPNYASPLAAESNLAQSQPQKTTNSWETTSAFAPLENSTANVVREPEQLPIPSAGPSFQTRTTASLGFPDAPKSSAAPPQAEKLPAPQATLPVEPTPIRKRYFIYEPK